MNRLNARIKTSSEDERNLLSIVGTEEFKSVFKYLEKYAQIKLSELVNFSLNEKSFSQLALVKAEVEGAYFILTRLRGEVDRLVALNTKGKK